MEASITLRDMIADAVPSQFRIESRGGAVAVLTMLEMQMAWDRATAGAKAGESIWTTATMARLAEELESAGVMDCTPENAYDIAKAFWAAKEPAKN